MGFSLWELVTNLSWSCKLGPFGAFFVKFFDWNRKKKNEEKKYHFLLIISGTHIVRSYDQAKRHRQLRPVKWQLRPGYSLLKKTWHWLRLTNRHWFSAVLSTLIDNDIAISVNKMLWTNFGHLKSFWITRLQLVINKLFLRSFNIPSWLLGLITSVQRAILMSTLRRVSIFSLIGAFMLEWTSIVVELFSVKFMLCHLLHHSVFALAFF